MTSPEESAMIGQLADRCEKATGLDRLELINLHCDICHALGIDSLAQVAPFPTSLDAAMTLVPEGWTLSQLARSDDRTNWSALMWVDDPWTDLRPNAPHARASTAPLAICAAALRARQP